MKPKTGKIVFEMTRIWLNRENLKRETESLSNAGQKNAIRTNQIKTKIDDSQQNSKCRLCGIKDKPINHMISEYNKQTQKDNTTRHE